MALTLPQPRHLARYRDLIALVLKYGRSDLIARARLEEILSEELPPGDHDGSAGQVRIHLRSDGITSLARDWAEREESV